MYIAIAAKKKTQQIIILLCYYAIRVLRPLYVGCKVSTVTIVVFRSDSLKVKDRKKRSLG